MTTYVTGDEALARRLKALVLGRIDMGIVFETASYLLGEHTDAPGHDTGVPVAARRVLETGLVVTYARPFIDARGAETLSRARGLPGDLVQVHNEILELRSIVFAHTNDTPYRQLRKSEGLDQPSAWPEDLASWVTEEGGLLGQQFYEQWTLPTRETLDKLRALAVAHAEHFATQIDEVSERLRLGVGPTADRRAE
jgi:hypothetical protein